MNCAPVTIGGGGAKRAIKERAAAFSARPQIFVANVGNGCTTLESSAVTFPQPGADVKDNGGPQAAPVGSCGSAAAPGGGSGGGSGGAPGGAPGGGSGSQPSTSAAAPTVPAPTVPAPPVVSPPKPTNAVPPKPTTRPGGVFITVSSEAAAVPTTLQTATKTAPASPPVNTGTPPVTGPSTGANSGACTNEGAWNCIGGTAFQRCASGRWSATIPMAAGTSCSAGTSDRLVMSGRRSVRRFDTNAQ